MADYSDVLGDRDALEHKDAEFPVGDANRSILFVFCADGKVGKNFMLFGVEFCDSYIRKMKRFKKFRWMLQNNIIQEISSHFFNVFFC